MTKVECQVHPLISDSRISGFRAIIKKVSGVRFQVSGYSTFGASTAAGQIKRIVLLKKKIRSLVVWV
ncbi:hypothetical protein D1AOALGA4SA_9075 [Olavius algarvensis Delta 1 endosymbiont]|nr:hypothetical protein D1AOALGA4SA_9075 [Olavius algarvensis Delta 1 endosymbiont]